MQESVKTKHPQLLYESKLYKILQGGSALYPRMNSSPVLHACHCPFPVSAYSKRRV